MVDQSKVVAVNATSTQGCDDSVEPSSAAVFPEEESIAECSMASSSTFASELIPSVASSISDPSVMHYSGPGKTAEGGLSDGELSETKETCSSSSDDSISSYEEEEEDDDDDDDDDDEKKDTQDMMDENVNPLHQSPTSNDKVKKRHMQKQPNEITVKYRRKKGQQIDSDNDSSDNEDVTIASTISDAWDNEYEEDYKEDEQQQQGDAIINDMPSIALGKEQVERIKQESANNITFEDLWNSEVEVDGSLKEALARIVTDESSDEVDQAEACQREYSNEDGDNYGIFDTFDHPTTKACQEELDIVDSSKSMDKNQQAECSQGDERIEGNDDHNPSFECNDRTTKECGGEIDQEDSCNGMEGDGRSEGSQGEEINEGDNDQSPTVEWNDPSTNEYGGKIHEDDSCNYMEEDKLSEGSQGVEVSEGDDDGNPSFECNDLTTNECRGEIDQDDSCDGKEEDERSEGSQGEEINEGGDDQSPAFEWNDPLTNDSEDEIDREENCTGVEVEEPMVSIVEDSKAVTEKAINQAENKEGDTLQSTGKNKASERAPNFQDGSEVSMDARPATTANGSDQNNVDECKNETSKESKVIKECTKGEDSCKSKDKTTIIKKSIQMKGIKIKPLMQKITALAACFDGCGTVDEGKPGPKMKGDCDQTGMNEASKEQDKINPLTSAESACGNSEANGETNLRSETKAVINYESKKTTLDESGTDCLNEEQRLLREEKKKQAKDYYKTGQRCFNKQDYLQAIELFEEAVSIQEVALGKLHTHTIRTYFRMGRAYCQRYFVHCSCRVENISTEEDVLVYFVEGVRCFKRALRMVESLHGKEAMRALIEVMTEQLVPPDSVICNEITSSNLPTRDELLGILFQCLDYERVGDALAKDGRYEEAAKKYEFVLHLEKELGTKNRAKSILLTESGESLDYADVSSKLGRMYHLLSIDTSDGDTQDGIEKNDDKKAWCFRQSMDNQIVALEIYQSILGERRPETNSSQANTTRENRAISCSGTGKSLSDPIVCGDDDATIVNSIIDDSTEQITLSKDPNERERKKNKYWAVEQLLKSGPWREPIDRIRKANIWNMDKNTNKSPTFPPEPACKPVQQPKASVQMP